MVITQQVYEHLRDEIKQLRAENAALLARVQALLSELEQAHAALAKTSEK